MSGEGTVGAERTERGTFSESLNLSHILYLICVISMSQLQNYFAISKAQRRRPKCRRRKMIVTISIQRGGTAVGKTTPAACQSVQER